MDLSITYCIEGCGGGCCKKVGETAEIRLPVDILERDIDLLELQKEIKKQIDWCLYLLQTRFKDRLKFLGIMPSGSIERDLTMGGDYVLFVDLVLDCNSFDKETKMCKDYDTRPTICRGFQCHTLSQLLQEYPVFARNIDKLELAVENNTMLTIVLFVKSLYKLIRSAQTQKDHLLHRVTGDKVTIDF